MTQRSFDVGVSSALDLNQSSMAVESAKATWHALPPLSRRTGMP